MSTDTAFALGLLALVGPRFPDRLRAFMLTVVVVDDVVALVVIGFAYSGDVRAMPLVVAVLVYGVVFVLHRLRLPTGIPIFVVAVAAWVAMEKSGVEPAVLGLALGLLPYASPVPREKLERATERFREFREQPTAELASSVAAEVRRATPRNERLQQLYHPWTSYGVVPLFALANAGIPISGGFLARAFTSSVTLGIVCGYLVGKPLGILFGTWLAGRVSGGRLRPLVGWAAVGAAGTIAGVGFTVSLLIATLAFRGSTLEEAKLGILSSAVGAALLTWLLFRVVALLPKTLRLRALLGTEEAPLDLYEEIDADHDHIRGPIDAPVTVVEYGDFECPYCGQAEPIVRELLRDFVDVRYVWRHLPLTDVHPHAQLAAEAAEAAAEQGAFWEMHDLLLDRQDALELDDLVGYAAELGLDVERFRGDLESHAGASRIAADVDSADLSGVSGTPTFFINGRRHYGAYDIDSLSALVRAAGARAVLARS
jgi:Na+/H+ antiporter NhaA/protein-disulfide isomerase